MSLYNQYQKSRGIESPASPTETPTSPTPTNTPTGGLYSRFKAGQADGSIEAPSVIAGETPTADIGSDIPPKATGNEAGVIDTLKNFPKAWQEETIRMASNLNTGFLKTLSSTARGFEWLGIDRAKPVADKLSEWGDIMQKGRIDGRTEQTFVDALQQGAGSATSFFIPSIGVMKGASIFAKVSPRLAMFFGGSAMAGLESMAEAGDAYETALQDGASESDAKKRGTAVFGVNILLNSVMNRIGIFNPDTKGIIKRALLSAPPEAIQEAVQTLTQNIASGKDPMEGVLESGAIGGILAPFMGGAVGLLGDSSVPVITNKKDTVNLGEGAKGLYEKFLQTTGGDQAQRIAEAIKQVESGGDYNAKGASGENGAYQFMPATWKQWAKQYLGNANAPMSKENQDKVALAKINELLKQGRTPREIALIWNGGTPKEKKGVNSKGVAYDSGAYANKVMAQLGKTVDTRSPQSQMPTEQTPSVDIERPASEIQAELESTTTTQPEAPRAEVSKGINEIIKASQEERERIEKELNEKKTLLAQDENNKALKKEVQDMSNKIDELRLAPFAEEARKYETFKEFGEVLFKGDLAHSTGSNTRIGFISEADLPATKVRPVKGRKTVNDIKKFLQGDKTIGAKLADNMDRDNEFLADFYRKGELPPILVEGISDPDDLSGKNISIIDGNHRITALRELGIDEVPIIQLGDKGEKAIKGTRSLDEFYQSVKNTSNNKTQKETGKKEVIKPRMAKTEALTAEAKTEIATLEKEITTIYKEAGQSESLPEFTLAEEKMAEIEALLETSRAGERIFTGYGNDAQVQGVPSTFPQWIPENLRSSKLFETLSNRLDINNLKMPEGNKTRQRELFNVLLDELDAQLGVDTKAQRDKINTFYGTQNNNKRGRTEGDSERARGDQDRRKTEGKRKYPTIHQGGAVKLVEGELIELVDGVETFLHKDENDNWVVSEATTGRSLSDGGFENSTFAVKRARENIEQIGEKKFRKMLEENKLPQEKTASQPTSGSAGASVGRFREDSDVLISNPENIRAIQFPELVALSRELSGNDAFVKKYTRANGKFYGKNGGEIGLNPELFKRENLGQLTKTMAHEIGHLVDYLPNETLTRGNLMGRLNTLNDFRKDFFAPAGASRTDKELREQMWELSKYWRPIDEKTASPSYLSYRKSSAEIYADFISVLFNDPRKASEVAPTAYNIFFQQLDKKPAVKKAYFELQHILRHGDLTGIRRDRVKDMFKTTEQEARERQIQEQVDQEQRERSIWFKFKTQFVDITEAVREKVKQAEKEGKYINPDDNPTYYLNERNYIGGKIKAEVDNKFNTIYQELQKDDMTWEDLGELMFYERILKGDRQDIANPLGFQPDFVQELYDGFDGDAPIGNKEYEGNLSDMKSTLGEAKFEKLQYLATEYRQNLKQLFVQGREEGLYTADLEKLFEENAFYIPFKGAKYSGTRSSFAVKQQKGTLGAIENPANSGIEKGVSIIKAIERNKVSRKTVEFLQEYFPNEVFEAKLDQNGYPLKPQEKHLDLVTYMQEGKVKGFYVDKYIADGIKKNTVGEQNLLVGGLRFMNSRLFRPLFITFNLGFQSFNLIRDFKRFWKNVPDMTLLKAVRLYAKATRASKIRAFGLPKNPSQADLDAYDLINRLENDQLLAITFNDIIKGEDIEQAQIDRILREVGLRKADPKSLGKLGDAVNVDRNTPVIKQSLSLLDFIENTGNLVESLPKIAGVYALEGKMPPREMRDFVRKYVGSPDFLAGGKWKPVSNEVFLFSNAIFQGIRADYEIATQPRSRGAYWMKTAQAEIVPKLLMVMATAGLFGDELKELFANVSEYDKSNYIIVPMGFDQNGKTVYIRIPSDESGRLLGGLFWKIARSVQDPDKLGDLETYTNLLAYAGGQVPSVSPTVSNVFNVGTFLAGNNPYDFFRARPVLTDDQMRAGGAEKVKPFLSYMFQQMGGNVFMKLYYNETVPKNPSLSEKVVNLPVASNIVGRFVKVSDYGQKEQLREITDEVRSENARENIRNRRIVFDYVDRSYGVSDGEVRAIRQEMLKEVFGGLPRTKEERTKARSLEKRFDTLRLRGSADAKLDALLTAQTNDEKVALLVEYEKLMSKEEFSELQRFIIKNKVVSSEAFRRFKAVNNPQ